MCGHRSQQKNGSAPLPSHFFFCLEDRAYFFLVAVEDPVVV
jgi:hypothetical protein